MTEPAQASAAPAAIVKEPGIDDVLERVEAALDGHAFVNRFLEGETLTPQEVAYRTTLLREIARESNIRLAGRVRIIGAWPELSGFGARLKGFDKDGRSYQIDYHGDAEARMERRPEEREREVREIVDLVVTEVLKQRAIYLHRMGESAEA